MENITVLFIPLFMDITKRTFVPVERDGGSFLLRRHTLDLVACGFRCFAMQGIQIR